MTTGTVPVGAFLTSNKDHMRNINFRNINILKGNEIYLDYVERKTGINFKLNS